MGFAPGLVATACGTTASRVSRSIPATSAQSTTITPVAILVRLATGRFSVEFFAINTLPEWASTTIMASFPCAKAQVGLDTKERATKQIIARIMGDRPECSVHPPRLNPKARECKSRLAMLPPTRSFPRVGGPFGSAENGRKSPTLNTGSHGRHPPSLFGEPSVPLRKGRLLPGTKKPEVPQGKLTVDQTDLTGEPDRGIWTTWTRQIVTNTCQTKHPIARTAAANADAPVAEKAEVAIAAQIRTAAHATITAKADVTAGIAKVDEANTAEIAAAAGATAVKVKAAPANVASPSPHP